MNWERGKFGFFVLLFQIVLLIFFILYGKYDLEADASYRPNSLNVNKNGNDPADNTIEKYQIRKNEIVLYYEKNFKIQCRKCQINCRFFAFQIINSWF